MRPCRASTRKPCRSKYFQRPGLSTKRRRDVIITSSKALRCVMYPFLRLGLSHDSWSVRIDENSTFIAYIDPDPTLCKRWSRFLQSNQSLCCLTITTVAIVLHHEGHSIVRKSQRFFKRVLKNKVVSRVLWYSLPLPWCNRLCQTSWQTGIQRDFLNQGEPEMSRRKFECRYPVRTAQSWSHPHACEGQDRTRLPVGWHEILWENLQWILWLWTLMKPSHCFAIFNHD